MAKQDGISQEVHEEAAAVARTLMRMSYKPLEQSKKGGPTQPAESDESSESEESSKSVELLKEEKPPKE